ncbi:MAG: hypothetical protein Q4A40_02020 [Bacillota bacterium]|nr:hypothetical protein [Bacillota bacterium]
MIFGLEPHVFFAFLSWPVTYIIIAIIMYFVMGRNDKKEEAWEKAYDEWQSSLKRDRKKAAEGGEDK